jgi:sigma-E factor negative regulatory protein RseB
MRIAVRRDPRTASRPGGSAVTSVAVLVLIVAPVLAAITVTDVLTQPAAHQPSARLGVKAQGQPGHAANSGRPVGVVARARVVADADAGADAGLGAGAGPPAARAVSPPDQAVDAGVQLLQESAGAGRALSYAGVQIISWWGPAGASTAVVNVTHWSGQGTLLQSVRTSAAPGGTFVADEPGALPGDVLGITEQTLDLLAANYQVAAAGAGTACGRPAQLVTARRGDGTLAARFWLDRATKIPLRRELFDSQAQMITENTFIDLRFSRPGQVGSDQIGSDQVGSDQIGPLAGDRAPRPWSPLAAADLAALRAADWPLPAQFPGGLALFDARRDDTAAGPVVELSYSDGLSSVSLFVQRGDLPRKLTGWHAVVLGGWSVLARDSLGQRLTWVGDGHVLTLIADAPTDTISAAVRALPHDMQRGFWARMGHGFSRLVSWADPFG